MPVTIQDIARKLELSHATVSYVLNNKNKAMISEATRQRVLSAAREMGYRPNKAARALVTGRTHTLALWMGRVYSPFSANAIHHLQQQLRADSFELIIRDVEGMERTVEERGETWRMAEWAVDGTFVYESPKTLNAYLDSIAIACAPMVSMGSYYSTRIDYVAVDLFAGAQQAVRHLLEVGCQRIAYLLPADWEDIGDPRRDAYAAVMNEAGRPAEYIYTASNGRLAAYQAVQNALASSPRMDGLFCYNDDMAIGACRALREGGVRIPLDVAVIGCDGIEDTEYQEPPISTIVQPIEQVCALAWQFLHRRILQQDLPMQQIVLQPNLVIRASSDRQASGGVLRS